MRRWTWRTVFYIYLFLIPLWIHTNRPLPRHNRNVFFILFQLSNSVRTLTAVNRTELNLVCTDHRISPARGSFTVFVRLSEFVMVIGYRLSFKVNEILVFHVQRETEERKRKKGTVHCFSRTWTSRLFFFVLFFDFQINRTNVYENDTNYGLLVYFLFSLQFYAIKSVFS